MIICQNDCTVLRTDGSSEEHLLQLTGNCGFSIFLVMYLYYFSTFIKRLEHPTVISAIPLGAKGLDLPISPLSAHPQNYDKQLNTPISYTKILSKPIMPNHNLYTHSSHYSP